MRACREQDRRTRVATVMDADAFEAAARMLVKAVQATEISSADGNFSLAITSQPFRDVRR
jgi:hypothetical protein